MDTPLFRHQQAALDFLSTRESAALFAGLGTGKTRVILEDARRRGAALFVICPKSAISVWHQERKKWNFDGPFWCLNYERIWREPYNAEIVKRLREAGGKAMLVLDESHRIKDRTTRQSKAARRLARLAAVRRILTGTPVVSGYHDLWAQMDFLDPAVLGRWREFAEEHLIFHPMFNKVVGVRNLAYLQQRIAPLVFHVRTEDVVDMPEETTLYREFDLPPKAREIYRQMERDLCARLTEGELTAPNTLVKILRLAQITGGFLTNDQGSLECLHTGKLDLLADVVADLGSEPFVVFARFRAEVAAAYNLLRRMRIEVDAMTGDASTEERSRILDRFSSGARRALVLQIQVGSTSIDLTCARYAIYMSTGFSFGDYEQSRGRIRRIGQTRPQFYIHLLARSTIDTVIANALKYKQSVHEAVQTWWRARHAQP